MVVRFLNREKLPWPSRVAIRPVDLNEGRRFTLATVNVVPRPAIPPQSGAVAGVVGIESGVVSGVLNLESPGVRAPGWRPRHDEFYYEAFLRTA